MVDQSSGGGATPKPPTYSTEAPNTVAGDPATDATVVSAAPRRIGRYALLERLGVGGMAEVYLAEQVGAAGFQKKVVLKRILPHLAADRQFVEMFAREAKVAAKVSHANVVQIFELGEEGGELYIAMEFLDGLTLHRLAASSWEQGWAVPIDVVLRTMADAAVGLHAAHSLVDEMGKSLHLVHRDVSPDNLMVSKDGVTKVLDFGIAKGDVGGPKTKTGNLRGKIPFMPPEQITGEVLDGRADLYALGVSMYWMLTGERPFDRHSDWHTMHAILNDVPKAPSTLNAAVTPGLDALIMQLLEKQRDLRPASGRDVAERLEELASVGSVGGKKTTVAFLAQLLPAAHNRGNPVSEVQPVPAPGSSAEVPNATLPAYEAASRMASQEAADPLPVAAAIHTGSGPVPAPISAIAPSPASPPVAPSPPPPAPTPAPPPLAARGRPPVGDNDDANVRPVTTPAAPNAISDILSPRPRTGPPVPLIALGLAVIIVVAVAVGMRLGRVDGVADAGVVAAVDAGVTAPPPPPPPPPPTMVAVTAKNAPARIRWTADGAVVGVGSGRLQIPTGTTSLVAEDLRWHSLATIAVNGGVADYSTATTGVVQIVRGNDATTITLGDDDISKQRKLTIPVGRYIFTVERKGSVTEIPIDVVAGKTFTIDASR